MALKENVSGTWKDLVGWQNVAGTWKKCAVWQNVAGTWKKVTSLLGAVMNNSTVYGGDSTSPYSASGSHTLSNAGAADTTATGASTHSWTWLTGGAASDFECRAVLVSGSTPSGSAMSTWLALSSTRSWSISRTTVGITQTVFDVTIRDVASAGAAVSVTGRISITLENGSL